MKEKKMKRKGKNEVKRKNIFFLLLFGWKEKQEQKNI